MEIRKGIRRISFVCSLVCFLLVFVLMILQRTNSARDILGSVASLTQDERIKIMSGALEDGALFGALVGVPLFLVIWLVPYWLFALGRAVVRWILRGFHDQRTKPDSGT